MSDRSPDQSTFPLRTCVGCRRTDRPEVLLRAVLDRSTAPDSGRELFAVVPDPLRRLPGRGAWIHRSERCLREAERRQGFRRAFRTPGPVDSQRLRLLVAGMTDEGAGEKS